MRTRKQLTEQISKLPASTLAERLEYARVLLSVHGYLRDSENKRISVRLRRDLSREVMR